MVYKVYNPYLIGAASVVGGSLFGFDISSLSAFLGTTQYTDYFHNPSDIEQGGITASMSGGSFLGALAAGFLSDMLGRRHAIQIAAIIWLIGSALCSASQNVAMLIVGRVINGFCVGICSSQVPVYLAEISPKTVRGRIVALQQWSITWGILIMYYVSYGCSFIPGPGSFRTAWALQMIPAIFLFFILFLLPESPRWLASKGRWDEAHHVVANVNAKGDLDDPSVLAELEEVKEAVRISEESQQISIFSLFGPYMWRRTFIGCSAQMWQQLCGMNVMMYYITYVFLMAGLTGNTNLVSSSIQYVINVCMTVPTLLFIDQWGRRPLLLWGALLMALWLFIVGGVMGAYGNPVSSIQGNSNLTWQVTGPPSKAVIACTYLFVATFAPTWGPTAWVYVSEIFPLKYRAKANGLCAATNWAFNFALAFFVPPAFKNIQWKTYIVFGVFCVAMFIQVFLMFPETRQKSLEEIDILFDKHIAPWKTRSGSRMDERAQAIAHGEGRESREKGKRNSDTTLQQDENAEKPPEPKNDVV